MATRRRKGFADQLASSHNSMLIVSVFFKLNQSAAGRSLSADTEKPRACWRGKDKLGTTLLAVIVQVNRDLHVTKPLSTLCAAGYERARICSGWNAHFLDV